MELLILIIACLIVIFSLRDIEHKIVLNKKNKEKVNECIKRTTRR